MKTSSIKAFLRKMSRVFFPTELPSKFSVLKGGLKKKNLRKRTYRHSEVRLEIY